jgi:hypothetical protein
VHNPRTKLRVLAESHQLLCRAGGKGALTCSRSIMIGSAVKGSALRHLGYTPETRADSESLNQPQKEHSSVTSLKPTTVGH